MRTWSVILVCTLFAAACGEPAASTAEPVETAASVPAPEAEPALSGTEICGAQATYVGLKDMIFDEAVKRFEGDTVPLNDLRRAVNVRMEFPLVQGFNEQLQRTDCSGKIVIELPPGVADAFGGDKMLEADVSYSSQPAADGDGVVLRADNVGMPVQRLVQAATLISATRIAAAGGPQLVQTYNPSFDCGRRLTNIERMICQDEDLAARDRNLSALYSALRNMVSSADWRTVAASQREFLTARAGCADTSCLRAAYARQAELLGSIEATAAGTGLDEDPGTDL